LFKNFRTIPVFKKAQTQTIGASFGDDCLVGMATEKLTREDLNTWVKHEKVINPGAKEKQKYSHYYENYLELYQETREIMHRLADEKA
jgi:xylulokinase